MNSIVVFLNRLARTTERASIELWRDYVAENFTLLEDSAVEPEGTRSKEVDDEEKNLDEVEDTHDNTAYGVCSSSFYQCLEKISVQMCALHLENYQ